MTLDWTEFYPVCSMVHAHQMWGLPQQFLKNQILLQPYRSLTNLKRCFSENSFCFTHTPLEEGKP